MSPLYVKAIFRPSGDIEGYLSHNGSVWEKRNTGNETPMRNRIFRFIVKRMNENMILICPEEGGPINYRFQMFLFGRFRILHVVKQLAGKFIAAAAILKVFPVHGTVI